MPLPISPVGSGFRIVDSSGKLGGTADDAAVIIALSRFASDAVVVAVKMWRVSGVTSVHGCGPGRFRGRAVLVVHDLRRSRLRCCRDRGWRWWSSCRGSPRGRRWWYFGDRDHRVAPLTESLAEALSVQQVLDSSPLGLVHCQLPAGLDRHPIGDVPAHGALIGRQPVRWVLVALLLVRRCGHCAQGSAVAESLAKLARC